MGDVAAYKLEDFKEGLSYSFVQVIAVEDVDSYAGVSGDISPLHMDGEFASGRGFEGRVVHGAFLAGYLSRLVGVNFPGKNALIQSLKLNFLAPAYIGDRIRVSAVVEHVSAAASAAVLDVEIKREDTGQALVKGKIQVVFTKAQKK